MPLGDILEGLNNLGLVFHIWEPISNDFQPNRPHTEWQRPETIKMTQCSQAARHERRDQRRKTSDERRETREGTERRGEKRWGKE